MVLEITNDDWNHKVTIITTTTMMMMIIVTAYIIVSITTTRAALAGILMLKGRTIMRMMRTRIAAAYH